MKSAVSQTSLSSYDALKSSGFRGQHAAIVSRMQPSRLYSRRQLAVLTGLETSSVAGRVNELLKGSQLEVCGTIKCPLTGKTVEAVKLVSMQRELML